MPCGLVGEVSHLLGCHGDLGWAVSHFIHSVHIHHHFRQELKGLASVLELMFNSTIIQFT